MAIVDPSGVDDGSNEATCGILAFVKNNPDTNVKTVKEPTGDWQQG